MDRQAIADEPFDRRDWKRRPRAIIRYFARKAAFFPPLRRLIERPTKSPEAMRKHWDSLMSQTHFAAYLWHTIGVDTANAMAATMIKYHAVENPSVLDVGCAAGALSLALSKFSRYLGTDVSAHAIESGKRDGIVALQAIDLRLFQTDQTWDVIVFNEVLYYLSVEEAVCEVIRYAGFLSENGIMCVSMKHDPKSASIFSRLRKRYRWIDGMIWQRKFASADYAIRIDRECPGYLLGVFRK